MNVKKLILLNLPYLLFVYPFGKLAQAFRLAQVQTSPQRYFLSGMGSPPLLPGWGSAFIPWTC